MTRQDLDNRLSKFRESCIFYLKLDLGILAAVITFASAFQFTGREFIEQLSQHEMDLILLASLIVYALFYEYWLQLTGNTASYDDTSSYPRIVKLYSIVSFIQTFGHVLFFCRYIFVFNWFH